jgi:hypothetical protein
MKKKNEFDISQVSVRVSNPKTNSTIVFSNGEFQSKTLDSNFFDIGSEKLSIVNVIRKGQVNIKDIYRFFITSKFLETPTIDSVQTIYQSDILVDNPSATTIDDYIKLNNGESIVINNIDVSTVDGNVPNQLSIGIFPTNDNITLSYYDGSQWISINQDEWFSYNQFGIQQLKIVSNQDDLLIYCVYIMIS